MAFDWKDLAGPLLKLGAPIIGGALGGPLGATIAGGLGNVLANALGVEPTPEAVGNAIATDPDVERKLSIAEQEAATKYPALAKIAEENTKQSTVINATMQAEVARGMPFYHWRNLYGYSVVIDIAATTPIFLYGLAMDAEVFQRFIAASSWLITWYTLRFGLLGFIQNATSNEKIAAVTGEAPSIVKNLAKAIRGR